MVMDPGAQRTPRDSTRSSARGLSKRGGQLLLVRLHFYQDVALGNHSALRQTPFATSAGAPELLIYQQDRHKLQRIIVLCSSPKRLEGAYGPVRTNPGVALGKSHLHQKFCSALSC
jgi:hypothetical protein